MADLGDSAEVDGADFVGEYRHTLDAKGRVILPADFRARLGGGGYVTKLQDGCLAVFAPEEFLRQAAEIRAMAKGGQNHRNVARALAAASSPVQPDSQGRIAISQTLRDYAGLTKDVVVVGVFNHIELWDPSRWAAVDAAGSDSLLSGQDALATMGF
ncbi:MAG TPA: division/cell wall cluster transcriptional repressor MraZ [Acidimicrobiales bacterium]|nr:division/cell wall cluster transcriptional repressor MraZ [Acidimicrobiales bacterium]